MGMMNMGSKDNEFFKLSLCNRIQSFSVVNKTLFGWKYFLISSISDRLYR